MAKIVTHDNLASPTTNPYVGPRTFRSEESHLFFGREREAKDLLSFIIADRLVLFYAQSGAGKSSLLNTRIIPGLQAEGFEALPVGRVSGQNGLEVQVDNIFVYNLLLKLHQHPEIPPSFNTMTLSYFLDNLVFSNEKFYFDDRYHYAANYPLKPRVLLIDQFEEILTTNMPFWRQIAEFFEQLKLVLMADDQLWVVLTMREDFIAGLDPYLDCLPGRLRSRFYMRRLSPEAALEAIQRPAEQGKRPFASGVAETLVDNLRQMHLIDHKNEAHLAEFVEPVHLQAVCYQMWEKLKARPTGQITEQDMRELADVDRALAQFYEDTIAETVKETGISEVDLRGWFETRLITEAGTRGTVYRGIEETGDLPTRVADFVSTKFVLRAEMRAGGTWYELVHDRFVQPILEANESWRLEQPLLRLAEEWLDSGRSAGKLLEGNQLDEALATRWQTLGPIVAEFLDASQVARQAKVAALAAEKEAQRQREVEQVRQLAKEQQMRAEEQTQAAARLRKRAVWLMVAGGVVVILAIIAGFFSWQSNENALVAATQAALAVSREAEAKDNAATAQAARIEAERQKSTAEAERSLAETRQAIAEQSLANQAATLEAQLATPTSTSEFISIGTPTKTPTPNQTATAESLATQLAQVRETQTAIAPTPTRTPTPTPSPTSMAFRPPGRIVFSSNRSSDPGDLYIMSGDGGNVVRLITSGAIEPSYSPGSNKVVFTGIRNFPNDQKAWLYTITIGTNDPKSWDPNDQLVIEKNLDGQPKDRDNSEPAFSLDGQRVAFVSVQTGNAEIYVMDSDGSNLKQLTNDPANDRVPAWSPDSKYIAFASDRSGQMDIWVMNVDGSGLIRLTDNPGGDTKPAWSPDGQTIAFMTNRDDNQEIYLMDDQGGNLRNLTNSPNDEDYPAWSLNGNWLSFTRFTTNEEIFVMTINGDHLTNLTNNEAKDWWSTWVP